MYNGIGLTTPRGTGTSGYIQKNNAYIKPRVKTNYGDILQKFKDNPLPPKRKPNSEILEHERKRKIESELYDLSLKLDKEGKSVEEKETAIKRRREELARQSAIPEFSLHLK